MKKWYENGDCSPLCLFPYCMKNTNIYTNVDCISNCVYVSDNEHEIPVDYEYDELPVSMYPLRYKIVVWYELVSENELTVVIRMPMLCKKCVTVFSTNERYNFHREFHQYLRINQCKAIQLLEQFSLCEPKLKPYIFQFLPTNSN